MGMDKDTIETTAHLLVARDSVWQLANVLRDCMNRLETIGETCPGVIVSGEIRRCRASLERHAPEVLRYFPHPFGWPLDSCSVNSR